MEKNKIIIFDTTLRDGEQSPGCSMHLNEKLDVAEALEGMGVDVIEAGFPASGEGEAKAVREIAAVCKKCVIAALCRCLKSDIDKGYEAVKAAAKPRLHVFIATSPIHLQYKLKISQKECLERISECAKYAKSLVDDLEFSFEDASRTPKEFLLQAAQTAADAGARTINIPDTVGYATPEEMAELITFLRENLLNAKDVIISVHCHNDLGMGVANSVAAAKAGARQIECTVNGIGERAGNAALEEIVMGLKTREKSLGLYTDIDTKKIYRTSKLVASTIGVKLPPTKPIVGSNAFLHEAGIHQHGVLENKSTYEIMNPEDIGVPENTLILGKHSGKHAFREFTKDMGYSLSDEQVSEFFPKYKELADRKKTITRADIETLLMGETRRIVKRIYTLNDFEITAYKNSSSASVTLESDGKLITDKMTGDGPVDASFKAISAITGLNFKLVDYQLHSVTEGKDALGEASVKLTDGKDTMTGKGVSTDVLEASLVAYVDAINKLLQHNNE